ncbi:MAG TPA: site-specific integrase [Stackebrandtia sp.]|jgi:integrase|uniref:site-specific integrase n=1 Tax=Stackebrandtia sp. TaxID=2023065 RepID=UPI002D44FD86|nr:site-specific integrase [Stackebrandtia sp.]HZE41266.1 site-specific integrase [Stackebrandtia sp.]
MNDNTSYDVRIYKTRVVARAKKRPHNVRWAVGRLQRPPFSEYFATSGLAKSYVSNLTKAMSNGEAFDLDTGLPPSIQRQKLAKQEQVDAVSWLEHAKEYAAYKWTSGAANGRRGRADVLRDITVAILPMRDDRPNADNLSVALRRWGFRPDRDIAGAPQEIQDALTWADKHCPALSILEDADVMRSLLDKLTLKQDGARAAANYFDRRRSGLYNAGEYAVMKERLVQNPLENPKLKWNRPPDLKTDNVIDPRAVGDKVQVEEMLTAVTYIGVEQGPRYVAYFGSLYYAMLRPEEVADLKESQCDLPVEGWGGIVAEGAAPRVGSDWTDDGTPYDVRGLKHRGRKATRYVPIPPRLVQLLRDHIRRYGTGPDGRIFRTIRGNPYSVKEAGRVWAKARKFGLSPAKQQTPLLEWIYLLRASGISWRRAAGVPVKEVAEWAGHSPAVQERHYSRVLTGLEDHWKRRMDTFMNA